MNLRVRLLHHSCLAVSIFAGGVLLGENAAHAQAPVPLFLKQEAGQDANSSAAPRPDAPGANTPAINGPTANGPTSNGDVSSFSLSPLAQPGNGEGSGNAPENSANPANPPAFPSNPDAVQAIALQDVDAEAIGTLSRAEGGLGVDMWNGLARPDVARLIASLPADPATRSARDLERRILLSNAAIPDDHREISLIEARVAKLVSMGALDAAIDLARAAPQSLRNSMLAQAEVNALMLAGRMDEACEAIGGYAGQYEDAFWLKATVLCALRANDKTSAAFSTDLVREMEGESDKNFLSLVSAIRNGSAPAKDIAGDLRPIDIALMDLTGKPAIPADLQTASTAVLLGLVNGANTPEGPRLDAARLAEKRGLIDAAHLAGIYRNAAFDADAISNALDSAPETSNARQYAKLFQAASRNEVAAARAEALAALYEAGVMNNDFGHVARLSDELLADIPVNGDFAWFALDALKASIAQDNMERAAAWLQVARVSGNPGNDVESQLVLLYPLLAIAGLEDTGAAPLLADPAAGTANGDATTNPQVSVALGFGLGGAPAQAATTVATNTAPDSASLARHRARMTEWQELEAANPDRIAARHDAEMVAALFDAFGIEVPDALWNELLTPPFDSSQQNASTGVIHQMEAATRSGQRGRAAILAIQTQQIAASGNPSPRDLGSAIAALRQAGLAGDARRLATELMMASDQ